MKLKTFTLLVLITISLTSSVQEKNPFIGTWLWQDFIPVDPSNVKLKQGVNMMFSGVTMKFSDSKYIWKMGSRKLTGSYTYSSKTDSITLNRDDNKVKTHKYVFLNDSTLKLPHSAKGDLLYKRVTMDYSPVAN